MEEITGKVNSQKRNEVVEYVERLDPIKPMNMKEFRENIFEAIREEYSGVYILDKVEGKVPYYKNGLMYQEDYDFMILEQVVRDQVDFTLSHYEDLDLQANVIKKVENDLSFEENLVKVSVRKLKSTLTIVDEEEAQSRIKIMTPDGLYNYLTGELEELSESDIFISMTRARFMAGKHKVPLLIWNYLKRVLGDKNVFGDYEEASDDVVESFLDILAYMITPSTSLKKIIFLIGGTNCGKSTLMNIISYMIGDYADALSPASLIHKPSSDPEIQPGFIKVRNNFLVVAAEPEQKYILSNGLNKAVSGRDKLSFRRPHGSNITFVPFFKICIPSNCFPVLAEKKDEAAWKRYLVIEFNNGFSDDEIDPLFYDKAIEPEVLDSFFTVLLQRATKFYKNGEIMDIHPRFVKSIDYYYHHQRDSFENFVEDCCKATSNSNMITTAEDAYEGYIKYCNYSNQDQLSETKFYSELFKWSVITPGVEKVKTKKVNSSYYGLYIEGVRYYTHINYAKSQNQNLNGQFFNNSNDTGLPEFRIRPSVKKRSSNNRKKIN